MNNTRLIVLQICFFLSAFCVPGYSQGGFIATIPFQFYSADVSLPIVVAHISGKDANFLIDTGTNVTMIGDSLAKRLGLSPQPAVDFKGKPFLFDGKSALGEHLDDLRLGNDLTFQGNVLVFNAPELINGDTPIEGILGADFLKQYTVFIDYRRHRLAFWRPDGFTDAELQRIGMSDAVALPVMEKDEAPFYVSERINGKAQVARLDTGSSSTLIPPSLAHKLNLQVNNQEETFAFGGSFKMNVSRAETLLLGKLGFHDVEVGYAENEATCLGANVLAQCYVLLDPARKRVLLKPAGQVVRETPLSGGDKETYCWKMRFHAGEAFDVWGRTTTHGLDSDSKASVTTSYTISSALIQTVDDKGDSSVAYYDDQSRQISETRAFSSTGLLIRGDDKMTPAPLVQVGALQMLMRNTPTPDRSVRIGESWATELENGLVKGEKIKMTSTLLGLDEIDGVKTYRVSVQFDLPKTADHSDIIHVKGEYDLDAERGRIMRRDYTMENVDIPQPQGKLNVKILAHSEILPPLPLYENAQAGATPSGSGGKESGKR